MPELARPLTAFDDQKVIDQGLDTAIDKALPGARGTTRATLIGTATVQRSYRGIVFQPGDTEKRIFLVVEGHVAVTVTAPDGRTALFGVFGPGELLGLLTLDGGSLPLGLESLDDAVFASWPTRRMLEVTAQDGAAQRDLFELMVRRFRYAAALVGLTTFATAEARLAYFLLRYETLAFSAAMPRLRRSQLAALAGASPQMVGRILRRWERSGIIRRVGRHGLRLLDRAALSLDAAEIADYGGR